jgi:hypothetical protein
MRYWSLAIILLVFFIGCESKRQASRSAQRAMSQHQVNLERTDREEVPDGGLKTRVVTTEELLSIHRKEPNLTPSACKEILARLNTKAPYHISDDIREGRPLKVPNDFRAYRDWTPLPKEISELARVPKAILIVMEQYPFMGWYERGMLVADTYACIGKAGEETEAGVYRVKDKDPDKVSLSYKNPYGQPAMMPWALKIYGNVWIHAGDVTDAYCSHGCIILPPDPAQDVYHWSDMGTLVLVVESVNDFQKGALQLEASVP